MVFEVEKDLFEIVSSTNPRFLKEITKTSKLLEAGSMMKIEIELISSNGYPQFINRMYPSSLATRCIHPPLQENMIIYIYKATEKLNLLKPENMIKLQFNVVVKRFDFTKHGKTCSFEEMNYISTLPASREILTLPVVTSTKVIELKEYLSQRWTVPDDSSDFGSVLHTPIPT